jgi:hypothetical protein
MALPVGAFVEGELYLSWMQVFSKPFSPFILILFCSFHSFYPRTNRRTLPWRGD